MATTDDYSADTTRPGLLSPGGQTTATFQDGYEADWFKITLSSDNIYRFSLSSSDSRFSPYSYQLAIYDSTGSYLSNVADDASNSVLSGSYKAPAAGNYYLAVSGTTYYGTTTLAYTVKAGAGVLDDVGDSNATARALALEQTVRGTFESANDTDRYKVSLAEGTTYTITYNWTVDAAGAYSSNSMRIENAAGEAIGYSYHYDGKVSFVANVAGDYYIAAMADSRAATASTAYTLNVSKAADDYLANAAGAGLLPNGFSASGKLEVPRDRDWFATTLEADGTYWFTLERNNDVSGSLYSPVVKILDAQGNTLASNADYSSYSGKLIVPYQTTGSGRYYVEVSDRYNSAGAYTISAARGERDDFANTPANAAKVAVNATYAGRLELAQDTDAFKIAVTKGQTYLFELTASNAKDNPNLSLKASSTTAGYSSMGTTYYKAGVQAYQVYTADYTGDFYLTVGNEYSNGTADYALSITQPGPDDFAGDRSTGGVLQVGGKVSAKLDYTADADWFKVTLQYGTKYAFILGGAATGEGSLVVGTYGATLQLKGANDDYTGLWLESKGGGQYTLTTSTGGDYYIAVKQDGSYASSQYAGSGVGSYTLKAVSLSGDTTAPVVTSVLPEHGVNAAGLYDNITINFSEPVNLNNDTIYLRNELGESVASFYASDAGSGVFTGTSLTLNPQSRLAPGMKYFVELPIGYFTDLAGNKNTGNSVFSFNTAPAVDTGGSGDDLLMGLGNGAQLAGGDGLDTALYVYSRYAYTVAHSAGETSVVRNGWSTNAANGDHLTGVERLLFNDTAVAFDLEGAGGQAYRLYQAAFNRAPDKTGAGYWIAQMDRGVSLHQVAQGFIDSAEFGTLFGAAPSNSAFVDKLYQNVLHRAGDQSGVVFWNGALATGTSRADVLAAFSESAENQAAVLKIIGNGFEYIPYG